MPGMLRATVRFQIEELILVPPILLRLARDAIVSDFDIRCVKRWTSGAAPISAEVLKALQTRFPWTSFRQGYGATEAACVAAHPPTHWDYKYGESVGMLIANTAAKIVDSDGQELGPRQSGEILIMGPQVALGYLDNPQATAESFSADGFYRTGDLGYIDEEGLIYIEDRMKEMIKVKGSQVPPAELEDLLLGHEDIDDCAVISIPDEYAGELPKAFVVLKPNVPRNDISGRRLIDYVRQNKIRYKWLVEVEFIDKIPKSPAGKLLRRVLKERELARARGELPTGGVEEGVRVRASAIVSQPRLPTTTSPGLPDMHRSSLNAFFFSSRKRAFDLIWCTLLPSFSRIMNTLRYTFARTTKLVSGHGEKLPY